VRSPLIAVSAGIGPLHHSAALDTLERWSYAHGGLPTRLLDEEALQHVRDAPTGPLTAYQAAWIRAHLLDIIEPKFTTIIWLDADVKCVSPWLHLVRKRAHVQAVTKPHNYLNDQIWPLQFKVDASVMVFLRSPITVTFCKRWWKQRNAYLWEDVPSDPLTHTIQREELLPFRFYFWAFHKTLSWDPSADGPPPEDVKNLHFKGSLRGKHGSRV
jgi:hypothetical protein